MKRYTKREVSRLLGEVRSDHAEFRKAERGDGDAFSITCWCRKCEDLSRVVRQMRRDLAEYDGRLNQLADKTMENVRTHERLRKQIDEARAAVRWRPIASAPIDGTAILVRCSLTGPREAHHERGWWMPHHVAAFPIRQPTHWMPLPDGPREG